VILPVLPDLVLYRSLRNLPIVARCILTDALVQSGTEVLECQLGSINSRPSLSTGLCNAPVPVWLLNEAPVQVVAIDPETLLQI
jgi:hypothetical protein